MIARVLLDLVAVTLATGGIVDYWKNGSIFATCRASVEDGRAWWCQLFNCSYCMNGQTPLWLLLAQFVPSVLVGEPWCYVIMVPTYWMAAAYVAWVVNCARGKDRDYDRKLRKGLPQTEAELEAIVDEAMQENSTNDFSSGYQYALDDVRRGKVDAPDADAFAYAARVNAG